MEPAQAPLKINYTILAAIDKVEECFIDAYQGGFGASTEFKRTSVGWFVHFEGSHEALYFGETKPKLSTGDKVKITFEKV